MESSATTETERRLRSDTRTLPRSPEELVALFKRLIELPGIQKVEVTPQNITVQRLISDQEQVIPEVGEGEAAEVDPIFLPTAISKNEALVELSFDPERHPYHALLGATDMIHEKKLRPSFIVAPEGEWLGAYLGLPEGTVPESCFGMRVIYTRDDAFEDKLLVLGGLSNLLTDVSIGVAINLGV
jgi:hypothetical protein